MNRVIVLLSDDLKAELKAEAKECLCEKLGPHIRHILKQRALRIKT